MWVIESEEFLNMLRLSNLSVPLDYTDSSLRAAILKKCSLSSDQLLSYSVVRRSVDARDKSSLHFVLSVDLKVKNEQALLKKCRFLSRAPAVPSFSLPACRFSVPPLGSVAMPGKNLASPPKDVV